MNTATASSAAAKPLEFYYPLSCKEFTEEQLLQHMRIPGAIWKAPRAHPRRRAALVGISRPTGIYQTVFFGATKADSEEEWVEVKPKRRGHSKKWLGARAAIEH
jgi:hypothetical protein